MLRVQLPLLHHYHPTVSLHARQLLASEPITSSPDLTLHTLSHFLDRFVFKNPKKSKSKGASAMQPAVSAADGVAVKRFKGEVSGGALPNEEKFWKTRVEDVPVDEVRPLSVVYVTLSHSAPRSSSTNTLREKIARDSLKLIRMREAKRRIRKNLRTLESVESVTMAM